MKKLLRTSALILLTMATISSSAGAEVYVTTEYENGQAVKVYTNPEAQRLKKVMRTRRNNSNDNAFIVNVPATPVSLARHSHRSSIFGGPIPKVYSFAESGYKELPRRTLVYGQKGSSMQFCNLSEVILREARNNNLDPLLLELIIKHESAFNPNAVSRSGAQGLMQLMPGTAAGLGVTDSFDPHQNVAGGARYFAEQLSRFQDLRKALAAYNAGPGAVESHGGIPPYEETIGYVSRIAGEYESRKTTTGKPQAEADEGRETAGR